MITIAFDIDGTLIDLNGKPVFKMVELCKSLASLPNMKVYVWSGGGMNYTLQRARELKLDKLPIYFSTKGGIQADICIDDQQARLATINLIIH